MGLGVLHNPAFRSGLSSRQGARDKDLYACSGGRKGPVVFISRNDLSRSHADKRACGRTGCNSTGTKVRTRTRDLGTQPLGPSSPRLSGGEVSCPPEVDHGPPTTVG